MRYAIGLYLLGAVWVEAQLNQPWPKQTAQVPIEVRLVAEEPAMPRFIWESAHFSIASDVRLPVGVVRDLVAVFEATHEALTAVPLGLELPDTDRKLRVRLFGATEGYVAAGGPTASGGHFNGREMLILLPNLGIERTPRGLTPHQKQETPQPWPSRFV